MSALARARVAIAVISLTFGLLLGAPPARVAAACGVGSVCATLTVTLLGDGTGSATTLKNGVPDGKINCARSRGQDSGTCSYTYPVTFAAVNFDVYVKPAAGSSVCFTTCFAEGLGGHWTGTLSDTSGDQSRTFFMVLGTRTVSLTLTGTGHGKVASVPAGIDCSTTGGTCSASFTFGTTVRLTVYTDPGSIFGGWPQAFLDPCTVPYGEPDVCELDLIYSGDPPNFTNPAITIGFATAPTPTPTPRGTPRPTPTTSPRSTPRPTVTPPPAVKATSPASPAATTAMPTSSLDAIATEGGSSFLTDAPSLSSAQATPGPTAAPATSALVQSEPSPPWPAMVLVLLFATIAVAGAFVFGIRRGRQRAPSAPSAPSGPSEMP